VKTTHLVFGDSVWGWWRVGYYHGVGVGGLCVCFYQNKILWFSKSEQFEEKMKKFDALDMLHTKRVKNIFLRKSDTFAKNRHPW
jgi:hypothetical protein